MARPARSGGHLLHRLAAGVAVVLLAGCAITPPVTVTPAPPAASPTPTTSGVGSTSPHEPTPVLSVKKPVKGWCAETATTIEPPKDIEKVCRIKDTNIVTGHANPPTRKPAYLQRVAAKLGVGDVVKLKGVKGLFRVTDRASIKKGKLPDEVFDPSTGLWWLVTCDPESGYRNGHAINNLVLELTPLQEEAP